MKWIVILLLLPGPVLAAGKICPFGACLGQSVDGVKTHGHNFGYLWGQEFYPDIRSGYFSRYAVVIVSSTKVVAQIQASSRLISLPKILCASKLQEIATALEDKYGQFVFTSTLSPAYKIKLHDGKYSIFLYCEPAKQVGRYEWEFFTTLEYTDISLFNIAVREYKELKRKKGKRGL